MKKYIFIVLFFSIFHLINAQLFSMRVFDNLHNTRIISTKHFNIVCKEETSYIAKDLIKTAEGIYAELKIKMRTEPIDKINILLTDQADIPNGFAMQIPNNTINLYMTASSPDFIANENNWLEYVLLHEMTHIFNLTATYPKFIKYTHNSCFYIPNTVMPMYFLEGYTVFNESTILKGRMYNTNYEALLRTMLIDNDKQPLDRAVSYYNRNYPYGTLAYLYGAYIFDQYNKKNNNLTYFNYSYCLSCFPIGALFPDISLLFLGGILPNTALKNVFKDAEKRNYELLSNFIFNTRKNITKSGGNNRLPTIYNNTLYFIGTFNNSSSYLCYYKNEKIKKLHRIVGTQKISIAKINGEDFIFTDNISQYKNIDLFYDIYVYNMQTKEFSKLPRTTRGMYPMIYNNKLIFIRNRFDKQYFIIYDLQQKTPIDSFAFSDNYRYFNPTINKNGDILVSVFRNSNTDIAKISNIESKSPSIEFIVYSKGVDFYPVWSESKNGFYFISDFEKINNVYFYSFDNNSVYSVYITPYNVLSFDIDEQKNGLFNKIYVQDLSSKGFDIYYSGIKNDFNKNFSNVDMSAPPSLALNNIDIKESKYSILKFSSPGFIFNIPLVLPSNSSDSSLKFNFLDYLIWENSDIAHGIDYSTILVPFALIHDYDSTNNRTIMNYVYNYYQYFSIHLFTPDINIYYSLQNDDSSLSPDTTTISLSISKSYFTLLTANNISTNILFSMDTLKYIGGGISHLFTYNLNYGPKNIAYSKGLSINTSLYSYSDIDGNNFYYGGNMNIATYFPLLNNSIFIKLNSYYDNNSNIEVNSTGLFIDTLNLNLIKPKIEIAGFSAPTSTFKDLNDINIGITGPILFVNRGIPLPIFISSQLIKFDYIYNTLQSHFLYSYNSHYKDIAITYSLGFNLLIGLMPIKPNVFITYTQSDNNISYGFGISL